jgi:hypothetical protein
LSAGYLSPTVVGRVPQSEEAAGVEVLGAGDVVPDAAGVDPDFAESDFPDPVLSPPDGAGVEPESLADELLAASRLSLR